MSPLFGGLFLFALTCAPTHATAAHVEHDVAVDKRITALLFGEIDYREREDLGEDGFVIGQTVGQFNFGLTDKFGLFSEITATARKGEDFEFEIERLFVRYDFSDNFKLSAGRYHTPLGYWNAAFHHGSWLQTTVSRPETVKFGSNVIPIHFVGALLEGKIADSSFGYRVGFGNGRSAEINDPGDFGDSNGDRAWLAGINFRPLGRRRLDAGVSVYVDKSEPEGLPGVDEQIYSAYVALESEAPEVILEATRADHDSSIGDGSTDSIYLQAAYRLKGSAAAFKPYARAEKLDVDDDDPLLGPLDLDYEGITAGVRWDFIPFAALKAEVRREKFADQDARSSIWLQLSLVFDATPSQRDYAAPKRTWEGTPQ